MPASITQRERRYATLADASAYVGLHERTIRRHIAAGRLTAYRLNARVLRVDLNEIDEVMLPSPDGRRRRGAAA